MSIARKLKKISRFVTSVVSSPNTTTSLLVQMTESIRGVEYARKYRDPSEVRPDDASQKAEPGRGNRLEAFFDRLDKGNGIWKWRHYFEIYDRHFRKFVGRPVNLLEVGVFSGGSLDMWRDYFGEHCHIYGVDIADECKAYENERTTIFIGDQEDRAFWRDVRKQIPLVDILIEDGGHGYNQQIATFEEMFPQLAPGGVYVCEDVHGIDNGFNSYCQAFTKALNENAKSRADIWERQPNAVQTWVNGVCFYPFVTVIEKRETPIEVLRSEKRGTQWQPIETT